MAAVDTIRTHLRELKKVSHLPFSQLTDYGIPGDREPLKQAAVRLHEAELSLSLAERLIDPEEDPRHISYIITEQLSRYEHIQFPECGENPQVDAHLEQAAQALDRAWSAIREVASRNLEKRSNQIRTRLDSQFLLIRALIEMLIKAGVIHPQELREKVISRGLHWRIKALRDLLRLLKTQ